MRAGKNMRYLIVPLGFTLLMAAMAAVCFRPFIEAGAAEWKAVWVMNGPEYEYGKNNLSAAEENKESWQKDLTVGTQYGEICWETENETRKIPLYYGDREDILELGAGTYTGYGLPGEGTRILAGAHDTTYFSGLGELEPGDFVTVQTIGGSFTYEVTKTETADAAQAFAEGENEEELILYTCYPFGETEHIRTQRYLVYAARIESERGDQQNAQE